MGKYWGKCFKKLALMTAALKLHKLHKSVSNLLLYDLRRCILSFGGRNSHDRFAFSLNHIYNFSLWSQMSFFSLNWKLVVSLMKCVVSVLFLVSHCGWRMWKTLRLFVETVLLFLVILEGLWKMKEERLEGFILQLDVYCGVQVVCLFFFSTMGAVNVWKTNSHILTGLYN